ncbi:uncharacterized protein LOC115797085 [Archocentrus centrarchus]|uniref:uncharacterized protein LOC115797085 n=1 Tax=Archocentrus centrarchus TaxID=63155 RepID=UPI0011E9BDC8|nr:uncharacterized protein LOC115797085 [Archocentrus centrarchus]
MENTDENTPQTSFSSVAGQTMTTQRTSSSFTTSAPWTTTEMPIQAQCQRSVMPEPKEPKEPEDDDSNGANYIEDSCVAMLSFGPWIEKNCLDLLPFICYEDRFDGQVSVTNKTSEGANLTWSPAPGDISSYWVEITEFINKNKTKEWKDTTHNLTYEFTNLTAGTNYLVKVFAVKCKRDLNPARISFYTTPNKVTNLTITKVTEGSVSLSWNKPDGNLDFYKLTYELILIKFTT